MSEEKRSPSEVLRRMLDEHGIEWRDGGMFHRTHWAIGSTHFVVFEQNGKLYVQISIDPLNVEQAIAATVNVGETYTREECEAQFVRGFSLGCLPSGSDPRWDENGQTLDEHMAELGWVRKDATMVGRSCASCPEADNPDSYISHLQSALKWHDEHVPRPTNPRNTCVVLQGERPPEEVLFVREDGEVTHYLPEGTCENEWAEFGKFKCSKCGLQVDSMSTNTTAPMSIRHCPNCGRRVIKEESE